MRDLLWVLKVGWWWVDLVGEDAFVVGLGVGQVEPDQQLSQGLAFPADEDG